MVATLLLFGVVGGGLILLVAWRRRHPPEEPILTRRPLPFSPDDLGTTRDPGADDEPVPLWVQRLDPEIVVMPTPLPPRKREPAVHKHGDSPMPEPQVG